MRKKYLPLKVFTGYILFTLMLAFFGPLIFIGLDPVNVPVYIFAFLILFAMGYHLGINGATPAVFREPAFVERYIFRLLKFSIVVTLLYKLQEFAVLVAGGKLNFSLASTGESYVNLYADYTRGEGSYDVAWIISLFFYLPQLISMILGVYYFKKLPSNYRYAVVGIFVLILLVNTLGQGKQKQVGDIMVFLLSILVLRLGSQANDSNFRKRRNSSRIYVIGLLVGVVGMFAFINILSSRYDAIGIGAYNIEGASHPLITYNMEHPVFLILGDKVGFAAATFFGYLSQGYLGLSLSMQEPFVWTYGVGNSYAMTTLLGKLLGLPVSVEDSYPFRVGLSTGWDLTKWHSVFPWLASDFTFPGVLVVFFFYAFVYARCWKEAILYKNPLSVLLFCILNLGLVFVPANNQLLHGPESVLAIFVIVFMWVKNRWKLNCPPA